MVWQGGCAGQFWVHGWLPATAWGSGKGGARLLFVLPVCDRVPLLYGAERVACMTNTETEHVAVSEHCTARDRLTTDAWEHIAQRTCRRTAPAEGNRVSFLVLVEKRAPRIHQRRRIFYEIFKNIPMIRIFRKIF